jgi:NAD-dependent dihydropyrimidine dehydrogenase PreA subunit
MVYLKNVVTLELNSAKCTGCGICTEVCPHRVLKVQNGKAAIINRDSCMECGACKMNCPFNAINVEEGVGCAAAIIWGLLTGKEPSCG